MTYRNAMRRLSSLILNKDTLYYIQLDYIQLEISIGVV